MTTDTTSQLETAEEMDNDLDFGFISIHAPRVGSDGA